MVLTKRVSGFLIAFGLFSWWIWPTFLRNIWGDPRSWHHGATGFFLVHLVLVVASLAFATAIGILGVQGWRRFPGSLQTATAGDGIPDTAGDGIPDPARSR